MLFQSPTYHGKCSSHGQVHHPEKAQCLLPLSGWMVRRGGQSAKKGEYVTCHEVLPTGSSQSFVKVAQKAKAERGTKSLNQNK